MDPDNRNRTSEHKARIKRLRKIIIAAAAVMMILPTILSLVALARISSLDSKLNELTDILCEMNANMSMSVHDSAEPKTRSAEGPTPLQERSLILSRIVCAGRKDQRTARRGRAVHP